MHFDVVGDPAAEHRNTVRQRRWRSHVVEARLHVAHACEQRHFAVRAEVGAALAGLCVNGDQARVGRRGQDSFRTVGGRLRRFEVRDAATGRGETDFRVLQLRVEAPALGSAIDIECGDDVAREADIQRVADLQRCRFERSADTSAIGPRDLQLVDVGSVDLIERRVARAGRSPAPMLPVARGGLRFVGPCRKRQRRIGLAQRDCDADRNETGRCSPADWGSEQRALDGHAQRVARLRPHQPQSQHQERQHARRERPAVETGFRDGPDDRAECQQAVEVSAPSLAAPELHSGGDEHCSGNRVVQRSTEGCQPDTAGEQREPDQQQHRRKDSRRTRATAPVQTGDGVHVGPAWSFCAAMYSGSTSRLHASRRRRAHMQGPGCFLLTERCQ